MKDKKYGKVRGHCHYTGWYRGAAYTYVLKNIIYLKNSCRFSYWIKLWLSSYHKRAEEFQRQVTCLGENTEKYITFTVTIEKEFTIINKNGEKITKRKSYILQFIHSARFMARSLSNLVNNPSAGIHRIKC